jgi:hypothetical protein
LTGLLAALILPPYISVPRKIRVHLFTTGMWRLTLAAAMFAVVDVLCKQTLRDQTWT